MKKYKKQHWPGIIFESSTSFETINIIAQAKLLFNLKQKLCFSSISLENRKMLLKICYLYGFKTWMIGDWMVLKFDATEE